MFLTSNTQTRRQERIRYPADSGNKAQVCLSKTLLSTWVWSQHSRVRHERTAQCTTVSEKQEPEDTAYLVGIALGLIPSTKVYKYLCVCIHIYFYIFSILAFFTFYISYSMSTLPTFEHARAHLEKSPGLGSYFLPCGGRVSPAASDPHFIRQGSRPASFQAILSQPPHFTIRIYDYRYRVQHAAFYGRFRELNSGLSALHG